MKKIILIGHINPDLDCKLSKAIIKENFEVIKEIEVPVKARLEELREIANQYKDMMVIAVDVGHVEGHYTEGNLHVYDHHGGNKYPNAVAVLAEEFDVPKQAIEAADNFNFVGFGVPAPVVAVRYFSDEELLRFAKNNELNKIPQGVTNEQKRAMMNVKYQADKVRELIRRSQKVNGLVIVRRYSAVGFIAAWEMGLDYYLGISDYRDKNGRFYHDRYTCAFIANANKGLKVPAEIVKLFKDEFGKDAFVHESGHMVIFGGFKNPGIYKVGNKEDFIRKVIAIFKEVK